MTGYEAGHVFEKAKATIESICLLSEEQLYLFEKVLTQAIIEVRAEKTVKNKC